MDSFDVDENPATASSRSPGATTKANPRALTAIMIWAAVLLVGIAYAILISDDLYCEPVDGSSDYGDFAWSVFPPGPTCTFNEAVHGFDEVRGPNPGMSIWLIALLLGAVLCIELLRRSRRSD